MDKYEYKVRAQEIRDLIASSQYEKAAEIADTIDWSRVKKSTFLCTISDLYKINKRYEDAIELLQLAYDRYPGGKDILYSLCELYLSTGDTIRAIATYKEFCQVAGSDIRKYILQYKVYVAQEVSLEERIEVLEELKKRDYREKWAYTLAYLYHRVGLGTKCVEECDELISWFGEGKYVDMAMELKMLHQPLSDQQQEMYNHRIDSVISDSRWEGKKNSNAVSGNTTVWEPVKDKDLKKPVTPVDDSTKVMPTIHISVDDSTKVIPSIHVGAETSGNIQVTPLDEAVALSLGHTQVYRGEIPEPEINVKTVDVGAYNTINLQAAIAEGVQEVLENGVTGVLPTDEVQGAAGEKIVKANTKKIIGYDEKTVLASDTKEIPGSEDDEEPPHIDFDPRAWDKAVEEEIQGNSFDEENKVSDYTQYLGAVADKFLGRDRKKEKAEYKESEKTPSEKATSDQNVNAEEELIREKETVEEEALSAQPPEQIATVLSQEADGQISFVVPEAPRVDKQITGQLNINDVLNEWARMKREYEEKNRKQFREQIKQQTGELFNEFETAALNGVLETLQREAEEESRKAREDETALDSAEIVMEADNIMPVKEVTYESDFVPAEINVYHPDSAVFEEDQPAGETETVEEADTSEEPETSENETSEEEAATPAVTEEEENSEITAEVGEEHPLEDAFDEQYSEGEDLSAEDAGEFETSEGEYPEETEISEGDGFAGEPEYTEDSGYAEEPEYTEELMPADESEYERYAQEEEPECTEEPEAAKDIAYSEENDSSDTYGEVEELAEIEESSGEVFDQYYNEEPESEVFDIYPAEEHEETATLNRTKMFYEKKLEESKKAHEPEEEDDGEFVRELTKEEKELFGPYVQSKAARKQLVSILDGTSMASYSGNIILTGGDGNDTSDLATAIMKDIKQTDSNFSGKVARITGDKLNNKKVASVIKQLANGALIIEKANKMSVETASELYRSLDQENLGIIVTIIDTERNIEKLLERSPGLTEFFTVKMNLKPLTADQLADYAVKYAYEKEYSIDQMGMLALHTQITLRQTSTHSVNVLEVREIVDKAIANVKKKSAKHFFDVLLGKRYDEEDMIILGEKDFR